MLDGISWYENHSGANRVNELPRHYVTRTTATTVELPEWCSLFRNVFGHTFTEWCCVSQNKFFLATLLLILSWLSIGSAFSGQAGLAWCLAAAGALVAYWLSMATGCQTFGFQQRLARIEENMATKADLENMATKADLENMATKADLENMATKLETNLSKRFDNILAALQPIRTG